MRSLRGQFVKAIKCAGALPILGIMRNFDNAASEYSSRFHHDLGLLQTTFAFAAASARKFGSRHASGSPWNGAAVLESERSKRF
jgi:hypothetical protein